MSNTRRQLLLGAALALLAPLAGAQERGRLVARGSQWRVEPAPSRAAALPYSLALPVVAASGAPAMVQFFARSGQSRIGPAQQFGYGITALEYEVRIAGAAGASYREQWFLDGLRQPQLDFASSVPGDPATVTNVIQFSSGGALPRGTYRLLVLVAEFVAADVSVVIA